MFCSFFKKIALSIGLFFSSFTSMFHHHKPVKPASTLTQEEISNSEFVAKEETVTVEPEPECIVEVIQDIIQDVTEEIIDIPVIVEKTVKEKIKELETTLDELYREKARLDKEKRREKKRLKEKRRKEEFDRRNEETKEIMNKIDIVIARSPKQMPIHNEWHLTEKEMDAMSSDKKDVNYISEEDPNNIFV